MAAPTYLSTTETIETSWTYTTSVDLGSFQPGDHLIISYCMNGSGGAITDPSGWTTVLSEDLNSNQKWRIYIREMDGTEDSTVDITTGLRNMTATHVIRYKGVRTGVTEGTTWDVAYTTSGYGTIVDPPSVTATWGATDNAVVALAWAGGHSPTVTVFPAGYGNTNDIASYCMAASCTTTTASATEDPGAFTISSSNNNRAATLILRDSTVVTAGAGVATAAATAYGAEGDPPTVTADAGVASAAATAYWGKPATTDQILSDLVVEWDLDGDGDFDETVEDITDYVLSGWATRGRNFASQVTGKSTPGRMGLNLYNPDGRFNHFNTASPINSGDYSLKTGRQIRVRTSAADPTDPTELVRDDFTTAGPIATTAAVAADLPDFRVQTGTVTVSADGQTVSLPIGVSSLDTAFAIFQGSRHTGAGDPTSTGNHEGDDASVQVRLTDTETLTFDRPAVTPGLDTSGQWMVLEYIGPSGGANEFLVRGRNDVDLTSATSNTATLDTTPTDIDACVPFISGVMTAQTANGFAGLAMRAWLSGTDTVNVACGLNNAQTKGAHITTVEFTGSNWSVGHGTLTAQTADSGTISLVTAAAGTGGSSFDVGSWDNALIASWGHANDGIEESFADLWPALTPESGGSTTQVDYTFHADHASTGDDFTVHVIANTGMTVTRYTSTLAAVPSTVDITSAGLTDLAQSFILGTSTSAGTGAAYLRGWRRYRLTSLTEAEHWAHRPGLTPMNHELQVVDLTGLTNSGGRTWVTETSGLGFTALSGEATADGPPVPSTSSATDDPSAWTWTLDNHTAMTVALNPAAGETISLRSSSELTITGTATSHNVTLPATIEADDVILLMCSTQEPTDAGAPATPTDWTQAWSEGHASAYKPRITLFWLAADGTEDSSSVTLDWGATNVETHAVALCYDGVDTTTPFDATATGPSSGSSDPDPPSITVSSDGAKILAIAAGNLPAGTGTPTISTGYATEFSQAGDTRSFVVADKDMTLTTAGAVHVATVNCGDTSFYTQLIYSTLDTINEVGVVWYWTDIDNYGICYVADGTLYLKETVSGSTSTLDSTAVENREHVAIGVAVNSTTVIAYLDGVNTATGTTTLTPTSDVGIATVWYAQRPPVIHQFQVWDRSRIIQAWDTSVDQAGVLATMRATSVIPQTARDHGQTARVTAEGVLTNLDRPVTAPSSVGPDAVESAGINPGHMIGNILNRVGALHPPAAIDAGNVDLGSVGFDRQRAITLARRAEETELGFLYETADGGISFADRSARDGTSVVATFTDDPLVPGLAFETISQRDWQGDIINRVRSEMSPSLPRLITSTASNVTATGVANDVTITVPAEGTGNTDAAVGDLLIAVIASTVQADGVVWEDPPGWTPLRTLGDTLGLRAFARKLTAGDFGDTVTFYDDSTPAGGAYGTLLLLVKNWYGTIEGGVAVSEVAGHGSGSAQATAGDNDPPVLFTPWTIGPTLFVPVRAGIGSTGGATQQAASDDIAPDGYDSLGSLAVAGNTDADDCGLQWAKRCRTEQVVNPGPFGGEFTGYDLVEAVTFAVRGYAGDPPPSSGGFGVTADNHASQVDRGAVLEHPHPGILFSSTTDAETYNDLVLERFDQDRPIIELSFTATSSKQARDLAASIDLSDRVRIDADGVSGYGFDAEFFVETITHEFNTGEGIWVVTLECSPATDQGGGADQ